MKKKKWRSSLAIGVASVLSILLISASAVSCSRVDDTVSTPDKPTHKPIIQSVSIKLEHSSYRVGNTIRAKAIISPNNITSGVSYHWTLHLLQG